MTVAAIPVPRDEATEFGVVGVGRDGRTVEEFLEKPADPPGIPGSPHLAYASMGNYVFDTNVLVDALRKDAADDSSRHDMGGNIVPMLVRDGSAQAYDFLSNEIPGAPRRTTSRTGATSARWTPTSTRTWTCARSSRCSTCTTTSWPILTNVPSLPPAKFVHDAGDRVGRAVNSLVSNGVIISGGLVRESVLSPGVRINSWASVERSVILHNTKIGRHAVVRNAIIDKNVDGARGRMVGVDKEHDRARGFVVSAGGVTVVGKGQAVTP